jgi:phosphopentomutase
VPPVQQMRQPEAHFERVIWIVLDSVAIGELPDAAEYGDAGRDTLGHIVRARPLAIQLTTGSAHLPRINAIEIK